MESAKTAARFNEGKTRFNLISDIALRDIAEVYTKGASKYTKFDADGKMIMNGATNWRKGASWLQMLESVQRHIQAFKEGQDFDHELGTKHLANAAWGLMTILDYYKTHPEFDDRHHFYLHAPRIGLDIDDVLADWCPEFCKLVGCEIPTSWNFGFPERLEYYQQQHPDFDYESWMRNLPIKTYPSTIPFEPVVYITNRGNVSPNVASDWLYNNGFPKVPVVQTIDKISAAKEYKLDIFVDDKFQTFVEMNKAGICTYLFDAPHNQRYDVGHKRIKSLSELKHLANMKFS